MTFIDINDYTEYLGEPIPSEDFPRYAARASEAVDAATGWRISARRLENFSEADQAQIRLAVCAQCEAYWLNGAETALGAAASGDGGYTIGKTNVYGMRGQAASVATSAVPGVCGKALQALFPTGLLYAGVDLAW